MDSPDTQKFGVGGYKGICSALPAFLTLDLKTTQWAEKTNPVPKASFLEKSIDFSKHFFSPCHFPLTYLQLLL